MSHEEIEKAIADEPMLEINADEVGEEPQPIERGKKFAIIFPKNDEGNNWILENE